MKLFRQALLEEIDALRVQTRKWYPLVRTLTREQLHARQSTRWNSLIGLLGHMLRLDEIYIPIMEGKPGGAGLDDYEGSTRDLDEIFRTQMVFHNRLFELTRHSDLNAFCYKWWGKPAPGRWLRFRYYHMLRVRNDHHAGHAGNIDQICRQSGLTLPVNPMFEYLLDPPRDAACRVDTDAFPEPDAGVECPAPVGFEDFRGEQRTPDD